MMRPASTRPRPTAGTTWDRAGERGSVTLEAAILAPALLLIVALIILGGRIAMANQAVDQAAWDAVRAASIERTAGAATTSAAAAGHASLVNQGVGCLGGPAVSVDTSGFAIPVASEQLSQTTVSVICLVSFTDLVGLGLHVPGTITFTATVQSAVDRYRGRR
jgi:Flp pilus assembly protein TadG